MRISLRKYLPLLAIPAPLAILLLALAALAVPSRSFAQAPTFNTLVTTSKGDPYWFRASNAAVGDFNGDGKLDAIVTDGNPDLVILMLGNGDGTFSVHYVPVPPALPNPAYLRLNPTPGMIRAADLNGDGKLDAVFVSPQGNEAPAVMINTGNDAYGVPQFTVTTYAHVYGGVRSVTIGDLNGDRSPDFIVGSCCGEVDVYLNDGHGTFTRSLVTFLQPTPNSSVGNGVIVDLNGDGKADYIVASGQNGASNIFFGNGDGTFQAPVVLRPVLGALTVADVNHDGKPDLIGVDGVSLMVFLNDGSGTFGAPTGSPAVYPAAGGSWPSLTTADINGDGNLDVVVGDQGSGPNNVAVFLGDGHGAFGAATVFAANSLAMDVSVGDFNGDGELDIATVGYWDGTYGVLLNTTVFAPSDTTPPVITVLGNLTAEATGAGGASVSFSVSATDDVDGSVGVTCAPASGSTFALGTTTVNCSATDAAGNKATASFTVTVRDTTPPTVSCVPVPKAKKGHDDKEKFKHGLFQVSATDICSAFTITLGGNVLANGEIIKITPKPKPGIRLVGSEHHDNDDDDDDGGAKYRHFQAGPGEAVIKARDAAGNIGSATCPVPQPHSDKDDKDKDHKDKDKDKDDSKTKGKK